MLQAQLQVWQQAQRNKYLETSIQTAAPAQLLIMLYDGAIRFCRLAIEALNNGNRQEAHNHLLKVQDIISELNITLNREMEISHSLSRLYEYFSYRLMEANIKKMAEPAEEVLGYLTELKEIWLQAASLAKQGEASLQQARQGALHG